MVDKNTKEAVNEDVKKDLIFENVEDVEDMKKYEILDFYPTQNTIKVRHKEHDKVIIVGPKSAFNEEGEFEGL